MNTGLRTARYAFVDVETTGFDPSSDRVVELACVVVEGGVETGRLESLVDPERSIPAGASAIHHITSADVRRKPRLVDLAPRLLELASGAVVVAHNASFDLAFLPMLAAQRRICTLRFARHVLRGVANYANQTLRYELGIDDPALAGALPHRALGDVLVTMRVFERLVERSLALGFASDVETLIARIARPAKLDRFWFGKHRGLPLAEIPTEYLAYVARSFADNLDVRHTARAELERRSLSATAGVGASREGPAAGRSVARTPVEGRAR